MPIQHWPVGADPNVAGFTPVAGNPALRPACGERVLGSKVGAGEGSPVLSLKLCEPGGGGGGRRLGRRACAPRVRLAGDVGVRLRSQAYLALLRLPLRARVLAHVGPLDPLQVDQAALSESAS